MSSGLALAAAGPLRRTVLPLAGALGEQPAHVGQRRLARFKHLRLPRLRLLLRRRPSRDLPGCGTG
ncbi:hypothetical protein DIPPA_17462 [Diplonema papillatum]|nr:hypothetical protein DIPPA_17462 [Diplonema papillatum]